MYSRHCLMKSLWARLYLITIKSDNINQIAISIEQAKSQSDVLYLLKPLFLAIIHDRIKRLNVILEKGNQAFAFFRECTIRLATCYLPNWQSIPFFSGLRLKNWKHFPSIFWLISFTISFLSPGSGLKQPTIIGVILRWGSLSNEKSKTNYVKS